MRLFVLILQPTDHAGCELLTSQLLSYGAEAVEVVCVAPEAAELDGALETLAGRRLLIDADLAGLNLALTRLMRRGELDSVETAVLTSADIPYLKRVGLPAGREAQLQLAVTGHPRLVGVIKDDSGGLCVDAAQLTPFGATFPSPGVGDVARKAPEGWWVRAVVDDQRLCDGSVRALSLRRLAPDLLEARAQTGRLRSRRVTGRSLQLACDPALIVADGIPRQRPRSKRTFWSEPALWRLAL